MSDDVKTTLICLNAYAGALEELLVAVVNALPNRAAIVAAVQRDGTHFNALAFQENFSDETMTAFLNARRHLLSLISKVG